MYVILNNQYGHSTPKNASNYEYGNILMTNSLACKVDAQKIFPYTQTNIILLDRNCAPNQKRLVGAVSRIV